MPVTYDSVAEGDALPEVKRTASHFKVLQFLGASWMWGPMFYDAGRAEKMGLAAPIVPGPMKHALMQEYVTGWAGKGATLKRLQVSHRRPNVHDEEMTFGGAVTRKFEEDGEKLIEVEVYIDNPEGERNLRGSATLAL